MNGGPSAGALAENFAHRQLEAGMQSIQLASDFANYQARLAEAPFVPLDDHVAQLAALQDRANRIPGMGGEEAQDFIQRARADMFRAPVGPTMASQTLMLAGGASAAARSGTLLQTMYQGYWNQSVRPIVEAQQGRESSARWQPLASLLEDANKHVATNPAPFLKVRPPSALDAILAAGPLSGIDLLEYGVGSALTVGAIQDEPGWPAPQSETSLWNAFLGPDGPSLVSAYTGLDVLGLRRKPTGAEVVSDARKYLGVPYRWGGKTPRGGFDCSGLVYWVFGELGVKLKEGSQGQWASDMGTRIRWADIQPGDVLYFDMPRGTQPAPDHVGIYIGQGQMIVAPSSNKNVEIQTLAGYWQPKFVGAKRYTS